MEARKSVINDAWDFALGLIAMNNAIHVPPPPTPAGKGGGPKGHTYAAHGFNARMAEKAHVPRVVPARRT
eukprot:1387094-Karenia_brevis.AAC.1